ncbi:MAG: hypothetical protein O2975_08315 [Proteobacteria bacterium]|nr:hypothetical protein [Pseudomonadota bacterium]
MASHGAPDVVAGTEALAAVDRYLAALNARDTIAIRDAFNFPHLRIGARGNLSRFEKPEDYDFDHFFRTTRADGWHHTKWDRTEVVFATEGKAHVAVDFTRYREDGSVIRRYFSLYVVTCQDGHWGIQVGSGDGG